MLTSETLARLAGRRLFFKCENLQKVDAMRWIWARMKLVVEPSAAGPLAVVLADAFGALDGIDRVGVVLGGGNVDLERLPWSPSSAAP